MTEPDRRRRNFWGTCVIYEGHFRSNPWCRSSKQDCIFWDLKFNFSSPFRIVDVGFYLTKKFFYYRIGNSLYSQGDSEPTFYNGYLFNNRREMDARQSTSYLPPTTGPINQAVEDYSAFSFTYNYPQQYQLASHESTATETPTTTRTNFSCVFLLVKMAVTRSIFFVSYAE